MQPEHSQTSRAEHQKSTRRSKSRKKDKKDKDKKRNKSKDGQSRKSRVSRVSSRMSEWKSQVGQSEKSMKANPTELDVKAKMVIEDREQLFLDEARKELLQVMVKSKDQQDLNFQTPEELQLKYENQMLKAKVAQFDKKINEMRVKGKRDSDKYQEMKREYKSMKKLMKERNLKLDGDDQDQTPSTTPKSVKTPKSLNFQAAMLTNMQSMMDKNLHQEDVRVSPLKEYVPASTKVNAYNSRREKTYEDSDEEDDVKLGGKVKFDDDNDGSIVYKNNQGKIYSVPGSEKFKSYKTMFQNLVKQTELVTQHPIVSMIITFDSTRTICVTRKDWTTSYIQMYSLKDYTLTFEEELTGTCIKVKEVEQNSAGTYYAVCYINDGRFRLRTFGKTTRTEKQIEAEELKVNEEFGLDNYTMPNDDFNDPCMTCCFISEEEIFVTFFHNYTRTHCHFVWNFKTRRIRGSPSTDETERYHVPVSKVLDCNIKNFPYRCFYNDDDNEIYQFYRQGQAFTIKPHDLETYRFERITELDLGQMVLFGNKALITRSSSKVLFFKQMRNPITDKMEWTLYHTIRARGFIYFIKGNIRIQLITMDLIYFYLIDFENFMPQLENVMYNFMNCNQMMFGKRVRNCIAYKEGQKSFDVYQRKFMHNLRVCVDDFDYQGSKGISIPTQDVFMVTARDKVKIYDASTFKLAKQIQIPLLPTETREINEIIGIQIAKNDDTIAIISGKNLVMNEQKQNQLFIFKRKEQNRLAHDWLQYPEYFLFKRIIVKDIPVFNKVCMQYFFKKTQYISDDPDTILFCKANVIFELNFEQEKISILYKIPIPLQNQPAFFVTNQKQDVFVVASYEQAVYVDIKKQKCIDLDQKFGVQEIKCIIFDEQDGLFYFLANKRDHIIGFYLIQFDQYNINSYVFLIAFQTKLNIADANINLIRDKDKQIGHYKELVIGYKTIFINTYTTVVYDLSGDPKKRATLQKHECFQLWESQVSGLLLERTKDYITFSKAGINVLALGSTEQKPIRSSEEGMMKMIHSLDSLSYLKIEGKNYINFKCQDYNNRVISIEQEWHRYENGKISSTHYDQIYKIKIHEITLRELLILQSFYICSQQKEIVDLVTLQPNPQFFYKTFLELGGANMASILAFDSRSMQCLLSSKNEQYFSEEYPIIYKNKAFKKDGKSFYYINAIKYALNNNQLKAVSVLLDYCCKYQNNFVSSYLLIKIVPQCIDLGVSLNNLFQSNIFYMNFDYDDWPGNHNHDEDCIRPYSGSVFDIRFQYKHIFPEDHFDPIENQSEEVEMTKVNKIRYSLNLLPQCDKHVGADGVARNLGVEMMALCETSEELEIFHSETLCTYITYKWETFGYNHHKFGLNMHLFYVFTLCVYVNQAYIKEDAPGGLIWNVLLATGIFYPTYYCGTAMRYLGLRHYFAHPGNYIDLIFIFASGANCFFQLVLGPRVMLCKILMMIIVLMSITRTFNQLRIYPSLSPIVVMLKTVIIDLTAFLTAFFILIFFFANSLIVIGVGLDIDNPVLVYYQGKDNSEDQGDQDIQSGRRMLPPKGGGGAGDEFVNKFEFLGQYPGVQFNSLLGSIGDFESLMQWSQKIGIFEGYMYWFIWCCIVLFQSIILLNFIIAEASASYARVTETLESVIEQNKCALLRECEEMASTESVNNTNCPKYLICRHSES